MAVGDNAADNAPAVAGAAFLRSTGLSLGMGVGGTTKDDDVVVDVDVVGAELLMLVGTDDARMVAVGETGTGWNPSIRVVGFAEDMIGFRRMDGGLAKRGRCDVDVDEDPEASALSGLE
jgi:hypothetical protein